MAECSPARGRRLGTVRARTTVAVTVVLGVALVVAGVALVVLVRRSLLAHLDDVAEIHADDVAALGAQGTLPRSLAASADDGARVQVVDTSGRVVASTAGFDRAPVARVRAGRAEPVFRTVGRERIVSRGASTPDGPVTVSVVTSLETVEEAIFRLRQVLLLGGPVLVALVALTGWVAVGRALRPVELIRAQVAEISERSLSRRVPVPPADDEVGRLAVTMNTMLDRIESGMERQRRFVADASHELQTPLASLRADLEVGVAHPEATDWAATARDLLETGDRMERLVRNLLYLARGDARRPVPAAPVDLDVVVLEEVAVVRQRGRVPVDASAVSAAAVLGRRDDLARVVRNLLDNADRHAASGVEVSLSSDGQWVVLVVADDGPGIPPADRERVFERFTRLDDARAVATGGTGLGLAIARETVRDHGGVIAVEDGPSPGSRFVVTLPAG